MLFENIIVYNVVEINYFNFNRIYNRIKFLMKNYVINNNLIYYLLNSKNTFT